MNRLLFRPIDSRLMDAADGGAGGEDGAGGGAGGADGAGGGAGGEGGAGGGAGDENGEGGTGGADGGTGGEGGTDKPYLGKAPDNKNSQKPNGDMPDEKAYLDTVVKDEALFGKNDNLVFDQGLIKAVIPVCQKHGIEPEAAKDVANAFAKAQFDAARAAYKERCDYFAKLNGEARAKYSDGDFEQINAGIDRWFKPGGVMNNVIRNSELGADPEFLALMHELGKAAKEDKGAGAAAGGGEGTGDANGISGLSKLW